MHLRRCNFPLLSEEYTLSTLLELRSVSKIYQSGDERLFALKEVSMSVEEGQFLAIVGASGSGKSTMMNILGALDRPSTGEYLLDGVSVQSLNDAKLSTLRNQKIGFVFQSFNLLPRYTAVQNIEVPLTYAGIGASERRSRAIEALKRVGLGERLSHRPSQLSGGQQQRVAIARALVTRPKLLLADEPTGALDTETTHQIMGLLHELHDQGMTLALVTHEADVAANASRIITMRDGRIIEDRLNPNPLRPQRAA